MRARGGARRGEGIPNVEFASRLLAFVYVKLFHVEQFHRWVNAGHSPQKSLAGWAEPVAGTGAGEGAGAGSTPLGWESFRSVATIETTSGSSGASASARSSSGVAAAVSPSRARASASQAWIFAGRGSS